MKPSKTNAQRLNTALNQLYVPASGRAAEVDVDVGGSIFVIFGSPGVLRSLSSAFCLWGTTGFFSALSSLFFGVSSIFCFSLSSSDGGDGEVFFFPDTEETLLILILSLPRAAAGAAGKGAGRVLGSSSSTTRRTRAG
eukprot:CAMPEP_0179000494 /NCGR_PEP_ID=MMETSP0795-20121207/10718_1 /TAXON_ID=88552 /ORGANISM="Amoebophrya sp., Strain Ameob2" /LENGTH=137 /DNA_ID=CAMNT_0020693527 /DNA_START=506 /DNA_END=915 /DNA_ORIENTATION=-